MEIEIKVKGDYLEDRNEMLIISHAAELSSILHKVREEVDCRKKYCDDVTEKEGYFLETLQEMLCLEWMD
jgi:hypothetical protein